MKLSLIICTYMRPEPLRKLLESVRLQSVYPNQILIIDGSLNDDTQLMLRENIFENLLYFKVGNQDRGLTKQRNYGISKVSEAIEIVCFLDDDTILEHDYFKQILHTYAVFPNALGVGGYITNEVTWTHVPTDYIPSIAEFAFDGWKRKDGSRFVLRKRFGLDSDLPPGFTPEFSHGRSIGFLPPSGKIYAVEQLMGGVSSFKKSIFSDFSFSTYFEGYGLYEDADFTLRVSKVGQLYINTGARLGHYHDHSGRPNKFVYGKMVVRNGYYIWRVKYPAPSFKAKLKWHAITLLLTAIRFTNIFTTDNRKEAFTEFLGRIAGWLSLFTNKPGNR